MRRTEILCDVCHEPVDDATEHATLDGGRVCLCDACEYRGWTCQWMRCDDGEFVNDIVTLCASCWSTVHRGDDWAWQTKAEGEPEGGVLCAECRSKPENPQDGHD